MPRTGEQLLAGGVQRNEGHVLLYSHSVNELQSRLFVH